MSQKNNYFIFTGGPGAGKTATINELKKRGNLAVDEVARTIIKEQHRTGGNATHGGNRKVYCDLMLHASIADYLKMQSINNKIIFFDRGIPDVYSYANRFVAGVTEEQIKAVNLHRYNTQVFLFPPWEEIYCHDLERKQNFQEAVATYDAIRAAYPACGYTLIEVPKTSIALRAEFILEQAAQAYYQSLLH